jgi:hypothetical protein
MFTKGSKLTLYTSRRHIRALWGVATENGGSDAVAPDSTTEVAAK